MYRTYETAVALGLEAECRNDAGVVDAPVEGAGAGADDALTDDTPSDETPDDPSRAAAATVADDEDDDGVSEDELADLANDPRVKRLRNKNRRLRDRLAKARPIAEAARALGVTDTELRDFVHKARNYDALVQSQNGRGERSSPRDAERAAERYTRPAFDRTDVPFDPSDPSGKYFLDLHERHHQDHWDLYDVMRTIASEVKDLQSAYHGDRERTVTGTWRTAADTAAKSLPERSADGLPIRKMFRDAVAGAFHYARVNRMKVNPEKVIKHYLAEYKPASKQVPSAANRQRIAENVRALPGRAAYAGGSPAEARDRSKERISDITRRTTAGRVR